MPGAVIYISDFQNKLAWKFDISVSEREGFYRHQTRIDCREVDAKAEGR